MKKEDLVIGKSYKDRHKHLFHFKLLGFDKTGDPVLEDLTGIAANYLIAYNEQGEKRDPACNAGAFGLNMSTFLNTFKPVEDES